MLKAVGMALIVLCSSMTGVFLASNLSGRVSTVEQAVALLGHLYERMQHLRPPMPGLIAGASRVEAFERLTFLRECDRMIRGGEGFPVAWKRSLEAFEGLAPGERDILLELGEQLGRSDLDTALSSIAFARQRMELRLEADRQYRDKHAKLYRTMGVLSGFAVVMILL